MRPKHLASFLDLPPLGRLKNNLIGLKNQGATCYLNSLFQALFMSPEFRSSLFSIPLCIDTIDNKNLEIFSNQEKEI